MSRIGYECQCSIGIIQNTFKNITNDCDIIARSALCSKALLNENTGIYGCEFLEAECPSVNPIRKDVFHLANFQIGTGERYLSQTKKVFSKFKILKQLGRVEIGT